MSYGDSPCVRTFIDIRLRIRETGRLSRLPPEQPPQVGSHLVAAVLCHRVALGALCDEHLLPLVDVAHDRQQGGDQRCDVGYESVGKQAEKVRIFTDGN